MADNELKKELQELIDALPEDMKEQRDQLQALLDSGVRLSGPALEEFIGSFKDFPFSELSDEARKEGMDVLIASINHLGASGQDMGEAVTALRNIFTAFDGNPR